MEEAMSRPLQLKDPESRVLFSVLGFSLVIGRIAEYGKRRSNNPKNIPMVSMELVMPCLDAMVCAWNESRPRGFVEYFASDVVVAYRSKILFNIDQVTAYFLRTEELPRTNIELTVLEHHIGVTKVRGKMVPVLK